MRFNVQRLAPSFWGVDFTSCTLATCWTLLRDAAVRGFCSHLRTSVAFHAVHGAEINRFFDHLQPVWPKARQAASIQINPTSTSVLRRNVVADRLAHSASRR